MKDLMKIAMQATAKNVTTKKSRKSVNDHLFQMLYNEERKLDRMQIIAEISFKRYEDEVQKIDEKVASQLATDIEWSKINKTVKNGLDTAVCAGKTSASFCSNKRYEDYELIKEGSYFSIIKK